MLTSLTALWVTIKTFFKNYRVYLIIAGIIVIIVGVALTYNCLKPQPTLNEKEIQQASVAIEQHNDEKLKQILATSDARVEQADANINAAAANTAIAHDTRKYDDWTHDQLAAEMEKRAKQ